MIDLDFGNHKNGIKSKKNSHNKNEQIDLSNDNIHFESDEKINRLMYQKENTKTDTKTKMVHQHFVSVVSFVVVVICLISIAKKKK